MIKSEKGKTEIKGQYDDIIIELALLIGHLVNEYPELITGVLAVYSDELHNALNTGNPRMCKVITDIAMTVKRNIADE